MDNETLEIIIATLQSLDKLFDKLNLPVSGRQSYVDFFAKEIGLAMGKMKAIEIEKKVNSLVVKSPKINYEIPHGTESKFS